MKYKKGYKTWADSKEDIEKTLRSGRYCANDGEISFESGLQMKNTISHYPSPVFCVTFREDKNAWEYYVINYVSADTGKSVIVEWRYNYKDASCKMVRKVAIRQCLKHIIWIPTQHAFVAYCDDMTIRGYSGSTLQEKTRTHIYHSVLCMLYIDEKDELLLGGQGHLTSHKVRMIEFGLPVELKEQIVCDVTTTKEWVRKLSYLKGTQLLLVLTDETIYIISMKTRRQIDVIDNTHSASLTYCTFYQPYSYFITAARDGTIHVYHTVIKTIVHTFSAHMIGFTGVMSLAQEPLMVSWSQSTGVLRLWRLDTFELANEATFSESILFLRIPRADRLFYMSDCAVRIFNVNVLYGIFATLSSTPETLRLCSLSRKMLERPAEQLKPPVGISEVAFQEKTTKVMFDPAIGEATTENPQSELLSLETINNTNPAPISATTETSENFGFRLVCELDDYCVIGVSPVTGTVLNIVYPLPEMSEPAKCVDLDRHGRLCYVVLKNGVVLEFDCTVNPGNIQNLEVLCKRPRHKVCSILVMEICFRKANKQKNKVPVVFAGLDSGYIKLYDGGERSLRKDEVADLKKRRRSTVTDIGPFFTMNNTKAHLGEVHTLYVPFHGSLKDGHGNTVENILLSGGSDQRIVIWKVATMESQSPLFFEIVLQKFRFVRLPDDPTCLSLTDNVALFGFPKGNIELMRLNWKGFFSSQAQITVELNSFILTSIHKHQIDSELHHRSAVTSASESHLLQLFATSAQCGPIKIWDTDGVLIREIVLGDSVPAVCFANGRDLLASLKNHIVLIEAHNYLPTHYLEDLLEIAKARGIDEHEPEQAIPLEGESGNFFVETHEDADVGQDMFAGTQAESTAVRTRRASITHAQNQRRRMRRVNAEEETESDVTDSDDDDLRKESKSEMMEPIQSEQALVVKTVDKAEQLIATLDAKRMEKWPVAPDGYIPNSVIRYMVEPARLPLWNLPARHLVTLQEMERNLSFSFSPEMASSFLSFLESTVSKDEGDSSAEDGTSYLSKRRPSYWKHRGDEIHLELKHYLRGRRAEGKLTLHVQEKVTPRSPLARTPRVKKKEKPLAEIQAPPPQPKAVTEPPKPPPPPKHDPLTRLLMELSRERWCPTIISRKGMEKGFLALSKVMQKSSAAIAAEICGYVARVLDVCGEMPGGHGIFGERLRAEFSEQLSALLSHNFASVQCSAAHALTKMDDKVVKDCIMKHIMPQFLIKPSPIEEDGEDGSRTVIGSRGKTQLQGDEKRLRLATRCLAMLAGSVDIDRLLTISRLAGVAKASGRKNGEDRFVGAIASLLESSGLDKTEVKAWASFVIPLLDDKRASKKFSSSSIVRRNINKVSSNSLATLHESSTRHHAKRASLVVASQHSDLNLGIEDMSDAESSARNKSFSTGSTEQSRRSSSGRVTAPGLRVSVHRSTTTPVHFTSSDDFQESPPFRPVSVSATVTKHSSTGLRPGACRSKEDNLRRESVQVLKVMRRASVRSHQDLTKLPSSKLKSNDSIPNAASRNCLSARNNDKSSKSNLLTPSSGHDLRHSPERHVIVPPTGLRETESLVSVTSSEPIEELVSLPKITISSPIRSENASELLCSSTEAEEWKSQIHESIEPIEQLVSLPNITLSSPIRSENASELLCSSTATEEWGSQIHELGSPATGSELQSLSDASLEAEALSSDTTSQSNSQEWRSILKHLRSVRLQNQAIISSDCGGSELSQRRTSLTPEQKPSSHGRNSPAPPTATSCSAPRRHLTEVKVARRWRDFTGGVRDCESPAECYEWERPMVCAKLRSTLLDAV